MTDRDLSRRTFLRLAGAVGAEAAYLGIKKFGRVFGLSIDHKDIKLLLPNVSYPPPYPSDNLVPLALRPAQEHLPAIAAITSSSQPPVSTAIPTFTPEPLLIPTPEPTPTPEIKHQPAEVVFHGDRTKPKIYLTVDDCWNPKNVESALEIAEKYQIKLTFFPVGRNVSSAPSIYQEAFKRGHALENHTWTHEWLAGKTPSEIEYQILKQQEAVQNAVGQDYKQYFLRPPGGSGIFGRYYPPLLDVCRKFGYKIAMWSSDSNGWRKYPRTDTQAENYILQNVFRNFFKGVIVLQHAIPDDLIALPTVIQQAKTDGWEMDTMSSGMAENSRLSILP